MRLPLDFAPMTAPVAEAISHWRYPAPYDVYNLDGDIGEMLDTRSPYFAVRDATGALVAFAAYGTTCEVGEVTAPPSIYGAGGAVTVGLGLRPELTGQGNGLALTLAVLDYARARYAPTGFRLFVFDWNERARRVYERAGFVAVGARRVLIATGERVFIEMRREVR